ncbi:hypothetical protein [Embleya sp. AB8]|uniref:hypothetical protein n=1 Tax=Embleya sp. AB8 TaxID=3156304 RepID=UPI003C7233D3
MTGPDQVAGLKAELAAMVEELPSTIAPIERIEEHGRRARRRRTALIGASVAAVIVVSALTATSLSGSSNRASGPANRTPVLPSTTSTTPISTPSSPPTSPPTPAKSAKSGQIVSGELSGHRWELVHVPERIPASVAATMRPSGCEAIEVLLDGHLDNRAGQWCDPPREQGPRFSSAAVGDTALYQPDVGHLGTLSFGEVPPEIKKVVAQFDTDKPDISVTPVENAGPNGRSFYVVPVPSGAGYGGGGTLSFYDAQGRETDVLHNVGIGGGSK